MGKQGFVTRAIGVRTQTAEVIPPRTARSRTRQLRSIARRFGCDVYTHMAGGTRTPMRVWALPSIPPLLSGIGGIPTSLEVDIEECTSFIGFSFRSGGWNPHVETLTELMSEPGLDYEDSTLCRLYERFTPTTLQELFVEDAQVPLQPLASLPPLRSLFRYVWILSPARLRAVSRETDEFTGHHYFGPHDHANGRLQFERSRAVLESIEKTGFDPGRYGPIKGYFLADGSSYRFVVGSGNHRLAALKVLGHTRIPVALNDNHPAVISRERLDTWSVQAGGPFEADTAVTLFDKLFTEDGATKAGALGLMSA